MLYNSAAVLLLFKIKKKNNIPIIVIKRFFFVFAKSNRVLHVTHFTFKYKFAKLNVL